MQNLQLGQMQNLQSAQMPMEYPPTQVTFYLFKIRCACGALLGVSLGAFGWLEVTEPAVRGSDTTDRLSSTRSTFVLLFVFRPPD
jgi:hypothetical protein